MADYNKFGRLIKIDGSSRWQNYIDAKVSGNIVFAHLTDASTDTTNYPAGYYIYANGVEYKVADLVTFNALQKSFNDYVTATDASIARIDTSINNADASISDLSTNRVKAIEEWKAAMGWIIDSTTKTVKINGVAGDIKYANTEYVHINVDGSTFDASLDENKIKYGNTSTGDTRKLATQGYVEDNVAALNSSINASLDNINASLSDVSSRILATIVDTSMSATKGTGNSVDVKYYQLKETHNGATLDLKSSYTITGDNYINLENTTDNNINLKINVFDGSLDGITSSNTSIAGAGSIVSYVNRRVSGLTGALRLIGEVKNATELDNILSGNAGVDASKGCMWVATAAFKYPTTNPTVSIESGDQIVITKDANPAESEKAEFIVVERNLDGAVTASDRTFNANNIIVGYEDGKQTVKDSGYKIGLDSDTSTIMVGNTSILATEKAVATYVEGALDNLNITSDSSSDYLNINAEYNRSTNNFDISAGVNVKTFNDTTASTTAGTDLADAATFKQAIKDVAGTLYVGTGKSEGMTADSSALIALQMSGGNTSIGINGGVYAEVSQTDTSILKFEVKATDLSTAADAASGLAIASDVSAVINANELATATAFNKVKAAVGLTDNITTQWSDSIKGHLDFTDASVAAVIEKLDTSVTTEVNRLDSSIIAMKVAANTTDNKVLVNISQENGIITPTYTTVELNGSTFNYDVDGTNAKVNLELYADNILVGGTTDQWKDKTVEGAITDLSTMIENISTGFVKSITGDTALVTVDPSIYAVDAYVAVSATTVSDNNITLNTSVLAVKPELYGNQTLKTVSGLATDGYVENRIEAALMWENY